MGGRNWTPCMHTDGAHGDEESQQPRTSPARLDRPHRRAHGIEKGDHRQAPTTGTPHKCGIPMELAQYVAAVRHLSDAIRTKDSGPNRVRRAYVHPLVRQPRSCRGGRPRRAGKAGLDLRALRPLGGRPDSAHEGGLSSNRDGRGSQCQSFRSVPQSGATRLRNSRGRF